MIQPQRLRERMDVCALSQSELARRIGVSQASINKLAVGKSYDSKHMHRIARELRTTPEYLSGEIDDPEEGAPPPAPSATIQLISMAVALPSEPVLEQMFATLLEEVPAKASRDELARTLAELLPIGLAQLQGQMLRQPPVVVGDAPSPAEAADDGDQALQRARRR